MDSAIVLAFIGIAGGLGSAAYSNMLAKQGQRLAADLAERDRERERKLAEVQAERERTETVEQLVGRYRHHFLQASFNLQSRLWNIVRNAFIETYHRDDRPYTQEYARANTCFVLAEFLGWVEILRREVRFLDLGVEDRDQIWVVPIAHVRRVLQSSGFDPALQVMAGQQRAIGEAMVVPVQNPSAGGATHETIGYGEFVTRLREDPGFAYWFAPLMNDIAMMAKEPGLHADRVAALQHALIDLIDVLGPDSVRFPPAERSRC